MIKQTRSLSISEIFSNDRRRFYEIRKYQREYTWSYREWEQLFDDIRDNDEGYFLGSIICVDSSRGAMDSDTVVQLIDGQQRITSLSLLILAIYEKLNTLKDKLTQNQMMELFKMKNELVLSNEDETVQKPRITLQIQNNNKADYEYLLGQKGVLSETTKIKKAGNRKICRAFNEFSRYIEKYLSEEQIVNAELTPTTLLFKLFKKVNNAIVVSIEVDSNKDAYMLFESLNNRGIPLSAIDLIKNSLISKADTCGGSKASDECYNQWKQILSYLTDDYSVQERFFRQYYNTYRNVLNEPYKNNDQSLMYPLGYLATKSTILSIYEKLIKDDYSNLLVNLKNGARYYSILINNAQEEDEIKELVEPLKNLERIQGAPGYILLLYLLSNKEKIEFTNDMLSQIISYLIKFFVRRNITDYPNTRNLNKIFMDCVDLALNSKGESLLNSICDYLKKNSSSDTTFEEKLRGPLYITNVDSTRFILCALEEKHTTKEIHTDLWEKDEHNKFIWTIEHIFPEGDNIPEYWVNMIANGDKELANQYLEKYVHTIGNLTITGYNSNLSNMSFDDKKNRMKGQNYIGYKNGLFLNSDVVSKSIWTIDEIQNRTNKIVEILMKDFEL